MIFRVFSSLKNSRSQNTWAVRNAAQIVAFCVEPSVRGLTSEATHTATMYVYDILRISLRIANGNGFIVTIISELLFFYHSWYS